MEVLKLDDYDKDNLPEIEEDMEFKLIVADEETFDTIGEYDVKIDLK